METLNHGILRFNDEFTLKIDFDQETDDMTVTRFNDVTGEETVINVGGGAISLIDTITIDEDTRSYNFDVSKYSGYDTLIAWENIELAKSDWLYYVKNGSTESGGSYTNGKRFHHIGVFFMKTLIGGNANHPDSPAMAAGILSIESINIDINNNDTNNIFIYTYDGSDVIKAGSTIKVYGGNLNG